MSNLDEFIDIICGSFDNHEQANEIQETGVQGYPFAEHMNHVCNDKIIDLPKDFQGKFVLEESYYTINGKMRPEPRLFLFTEQGNDICLTSYNLPESLDKAILNYQTMPKLSYEELQVSEKFTPAIFHQQDGEWVGGSKSDFSPTLMFILSERFSKECLIVSEVMESNGKKTFGFDPPIVYKRK